MKYIKTYEHIRPDGSKIVYKNNDFEIVLQSKNLFYIDGTNHLWDKLHAIFAMADLIRKKSKYIHSRKLTGTRLRRIKLIEEDKEKVIRKLRIDANEIDGMIQMLNIDHSRTHSSNRGSYLNHFYSDDKDFLSYIPGDVYADLTLEYYPIIIEAIKESKTLGIIHKFTIIYNDLMKYLNFQLDAKKYNL